MSMSDPLADMLTRIRNGVQVKFPSVDIPLSNVKKNVAKILKDEGYISDYHIIDDGLQGSLRVDLKYDQNNQAVITGIRRVSKPGRRIYVKAEKIQRVMSGLGIAVISTSKGVVSDVVARKNGVGGEIICEVW
jgi:small subunit ribosomal protein S8